MPSKRIWYKLIIVLFALNAMVDAQLVTVTDLERGTPVEAVILLQSGTNKYSVTDSTGKTDITHLSEPGVIEVQHIGYKTIVTSYLKLEQACFRVQLESVTLESDRVIVSATRWHNPPDTPPAKIITIQPGEVLLQAPQTAADLLSISGIVFVQKSQLGGGSPMIRGFAANRLLYTVDGVRMNTAIFRGGNLQNVISLDPFAMERTEIIPGPGSVRYGSDAIGGVINFTTITPEFSGMDSPLIHANMITRYSSANNERTGHFDFSAGWRSWAVTTSITSFDFDHLRQGNYGPDDYIKNYHVERSNGADRIVTQHDPLLQIPSAYSQINVMQKFRMKPGSGWDLRYGFHYSETSPYGRYDRHNRITDGLALYGEWDYGPQIWSMNNITIEQVESAFVYDRINLRLAHQYFRESRHERPLNSDIKSNRCEEVTAYSVNVEIEKVISSQFLLNYGAEYILDYVNSNGTVENIGTRVISVGPARYPQATWQSMALYANGQFYLSPKTDLLAGIRYSHFMLNAEFDTVFYPFPFTDAHQGSAAITGSVGLIYHPADEWGVHINLSTGFRAPNVDDMGKIYDSVPGAVVIPNPDLQPEYAWNGEVSMTRLFSDVLRVELTSYYTHLQDGFLRRDFTLNGLDSIFYNGEMSKVQAVQNAAGITVFGMQGRLQLKMPAGFTFTSDFNYQHGEEELADGTKSPARHAAPFFAALRVSWLIRKVQLEFNTFFQAEVAAKSMPEEEKSKTEIYAADASGNAYAPSWYAISIKARGNISDKWLLAAGIENITDQRYRPYSSGISAPGRNYKLSLQLKL